MKKTNSTTPILAAVLAVTGCAPVEPIEPVVQDDNDEVICSVESSIGSHIKAETCRRSADHLDTSESMASDAMIDEDSDAVFRTVTIEKFESRPAPLPEAKCGAQNND